MDKDLGVLKAVAELLGEQTLTRAESELVSEIYGRLAIYEQECREFHEAARISRKVLRLKDPYLDNEGAKEETLQLHTLKSTLNNCVADQMQNMPEARILPETPETSELADDMQDAVRHIVYDVNGYEAIHRRRAEDFYGTGTSIIQVTWDESMCYGKGDIALIRWPIESFLWDGKAENIQDARALIKVSWHPMSWYAAHYPDKASFIGGEDGQYNHVGKTDGQADRTGADEECAMLLEYWYRRYDAKTKRYSINVAYCAGGALLEHQENVFMHGLYPFILDVHSVIEGSPVGDGMVGELTPMMRYINRYAKYINVNIRMSSKARMLTRKNSGIDRDGMANWETDIIEGDSITQGEDWAWLTHAPFPSAAAQQMVQLQSDLKQDSGANQFTRGETTAGITAGKAIAALQEAGGKVTGLRTDTLNDGFKRMVEQIIWLMAEFYTGERMTMITGRNKDIRRQIDMGAKHFFGDLYTKVSDSVPPPPYMVQIEINKRNPLRVEAMNEMYMQMYTMAAQAKQYFPLSALLQLLNIDGKDRILPIIQQSETFTQQMEQLQEQIQQLQEQNAQVQQENESLRMTGTQAANALANVNATNGGGYMARENRIDPYAQQKVAGAGGGRETQAAFIDNTRQKLSNGVTV